MNNTMELKDVLQNKLTDRVRQKTDHVHDQLVRMVSQQETIVDRLISSKELHFDVSGERVALSYADLSAGEGEAYFLHRNAIAQFANKFDVPGKYLRESALGEPWQRQLAASIMQTHTENTEKQTLFLRAIDGEARALLSDKYKPMASAPIFLSFMEEAKRAGAVTFDAHLSDLKAYLEVVHPELLAIETPGNGMVHIALGLQISSSDFGAGSLNVRTMFYQGICMNGAIGKKQISEVHLGKRLKQDDFKFSDETMQKDLATMRSAVGDVARGAFTHQAITEHINLIKNASATPIDAAKEIVKLPALKFTKDEAELIERCLFKGDPEDGVQGEMTKWKMQQAMTAVARDLEPERMREVQQLAGEYILN